MKKSMVAVLALAAAECLAGADSAAEFRDGTAFALGNMPSELVVEREAGKPVRFSLEENPSTGYGWEVVSSTNECEVALTHRGGDGKTTCGAPGRLMVVVTSRTNAPVRVEFRYRRPWEKDVDPWKTLQLTIRDPRGR